MKILDYETPTGSKGNLLNINDLAKLVLGVVVMFFAVTMGQTVAKKIDNVLPGNTYQIEPFTKAQATQVSDGGVII